MKYMSIYTILIYYPITTSSVVLLPVVLVRMLLVVQGHTLARLIYSLKRGVAGCSNESRSKVNGDAVSLKLRSLEISKRL